MGVFKSSYPEDLREIIRHAERFASVLVKLEQGEKKVARWATGRASEVRAVLSYMIADWRAGKKDERGTCNDIRGYLDGLHQGAREQQRRPHAVLECCDRSEAITASPGGGGGHGGGDTGGASLGGVINGVTEPGPWADSPEVMARFNGELVRANIMAAMLARRIGTGVVTLDDLRAFAREGLLDAARSFDEARGVPFVQWAAFRMRHALIDGVRRWGNLPRSVHRELRMFEATGFGKEEIEMNAEMNREMNANEADVALGTKLTRMATAVAVTFLEDGGSSFADVGLSPEEMLAKAELHEIVRGVVATLPPVERRLIESHYFQGIFLEDAAARVGRDKFWANRVHAEAIRKIEAELRRRRITSPKG